MATKNAITDDARTSLMEHAGSIPIGSGQPASPVSGMMQIRSPYTTAVQVTRPRDLRQVMARCSEEAAIAGDDFYYSWKQAGKIIEGPSVQAALAMVRNFGNCAVDTRVDENPDSYIFTATFIDLETGFNISRTFRQNKTSPKTKGGEEIYSGDRGQDVIFQIGQSKAIRNVILNALPSYLSNKVMDFAKANVIKQLEKMGKEKARNHVSTKANALAVPLDNIEAVYGRMAGWDETTMVQILSALRQIEEGIEKAEDLFRGSVGKAEVETEVKANQPKVAAKDIPAETPAPTPKQKPSKAVTAPTAKAPKTYEEFEKAVNEAKTHKEVTDIYAEIMFAAKHMTEEEHKKLIAMVAEKTKSLGRSA